MSNNIPPIRYRRKITGMSAILLPLLSETEIDWSGLRDHVARTADAGLIPAVNMDTGYGNLISSRERLEVLRATQETVAGRPFIAGAFVGDSPDAPFDFDQYRQRIDEIQSFGGTPVIFQSYGLTHQPASQLIESYARIGEHAGSFYAFELGTMFAPFGAIYDLGIYEQLMRIPQCLGAKHSSLNRRLEWQRLQLRDATRPDFLVLTGNDLAIDMVMYGSDYLLGLSTFAPEEFALRDRLWADGDPRFHELNDLLQYLGHFTFRSPVPGYRHDAAIMFELRGRASSDATPAGTPRRPDSDRAILADILERLGELT